MTATTLDPTTALVVVDLQNAIAALPTAHPFADVVARTVELLDAWRSRGLPVVLVNVDGRAPGRTEADASRPGGAPATMPAEAIAFVPELDRQPSDLTVTKKTWGAFTGTDLDAKLTALGVTQVVVTGIATTAGVESTARQAHEHGYNVTLATDAMTDMSLEAHDGSIARVFPRIGETATTAEILALLP